MSKGKNVNVTSHNQQGGITAYQVNFGTADRVLDESFAKKLDSQLAEMTFDTIELTTAVGDQEALRFASQFKSYLTDKEYRVNDVSQSIFGKPVRGIHFFEAAKEGMLKGLLRIIIGGR